MPLSLRAASFCRAYAGQLKPGRQFQPSSKYKIIASMCRQVWACIQDHPSLADRTHVASQKVKPSRMPKSDMSRCYSQPDHGLCRQAVHSSGPQTSSTGAALAHECAACSATHGQGNADAGQSGKLLICSACHSEHYCSRACQRSHWCVHKHACKDIVRRQQAM